MKLLSHVRLFATPWTVAYRAPLSKGFSRKEYWSGLPFPSPENLPDSEIKPRSPTLQADGSDGKMCAYNAGDPGSIPGLGKSSGEGNGNPLQYSFLENPMNGGTW